MTQGAAASVGVTVDASGALQSSFGAATLSYTGITVGTGNGLVVGITGAVHTNPVLSAVWDNGGTNQSMTFMGSVDIPGATHALEIWALKNPTAGNKTLLITVGTATGAIYAAAVSFNGVNAGSVAAAFPNFNSNTTTAGTAVAVNITSATNHKIFGISADNGVANAVSISGIQLYLDNTGALGVCGNTDNGAGTVAITATYSTNDNLAVAGIDVSP